MADDAVVEAREALEAEDLAEAQGVAALIAQQDVADLAATLAAVQAAQAQLGEREKDLKAQLRQLLPAGTHPAGDLRVVVQPNRRLDPASVEQRYPAAAHPQLYRLAPDTALVRRHLSPAEVDTLMVEVGEPKVSLR